MIRNLQSCLRDFLKKGCIATGTGAVDKSSFGTSTLLSLSNNDLKPKAESTWLSQNHAISRVDVWRYQCGPMKQEEGPEKMCRI